MALIIENGTGVPNADSFITTAEMAALETDYFGTASTANEAALRRAWVYMRSLDWLPDTWVTFGGTIPQPAKLAQCVLARLEIATPGYLNPGVTLSQLKVLNKVGEIGWAVRGGPVTVEASRPVVTMAFDLLKPYLAKNPNKSGGTFDLVRS
jgi:hypothetical protein